MKILIVMAGYFPGKKYGGPPVSINNFCSLMDKCECYIITKNHDAGENEEYSLPVGEWIDRSNCKVMYVKNSDYNISTFERAIEDVDPNYIYLQGLFQSCIIPCLKLAKKYGKKVMLAPRGELCRGAFKKKYKKIPYIMYLKLTGLLKNVRFQSTSDEETEMILKYLCTKKNKIFSLTNIPSIPEKDYQIPAKTHGELKIIFISRIMWKKNLLASIDYLNDVKGKIEFNIYGSIEEASYWEECEKVISGLPQNITVNYKGVISHDEVFEEISKNHIFLFPTFSENYGHVIAEALIMGKPAIISDQTPWRKLKENSCGADLSLDDRAGFINAVQKYADMDNDEYAACSNNAKRYIRSKQNIDDIKSTYEKAFGMR